MLNSQTPCRESLPVAGGLATKTDIAGLETRMVAEFGAVRKEMAAEFGVVRKEMADLETRMIDRMDRQTRWLVGIGVVILLGVIANLLH